MGANTLGSSIEAVRSHLGFWVPTLGINNEPALSAGNMVLQTMTQPPFHFPWNRNSLTFSTVQGTQDYLVNVTDFGYGEKATCQLASGKAVPINFLNHTPLGESSDSQQPVSLAVQLNTVGTSVKFRFLGNPNNVYTVVVWYQKFPVLMTDPTSFWTPIPDYMSFIYNRGLLAHLYEAKGDPRAQQEKIAFAAALIAASEGLTDTEINIFLAQYLANPRAMESLQLKTQQGVMARGQ